MKTILILFLLLTNICLAQNPPYRNLVFEGAGIRGIAYAGVLEELEKTHLLDSIQKVGGTSAGSMIALMITLGYNSQEVKEIIYNTDFQHFNDGRFMFFGGFYRLKNYYGWYRGDKFTHWLEILIKNKTQNSEMTFSDLHNKGFKDLYVTATCLNKQKRVVLSRETYPNMKLKDAVRISMSIPLYYKAVFVDSVGKVVKRPRNRDDLDLMVDGGIIGNFPIDLFDAKVFDSTHTLIRTPNPETIGVRVDSDSQIEYDQTTRDLAPFKIGYFKDYIEAFYVFVIENLNRPGLTPQDWQRTVSVSSEGVGRRIKQLSPEQKNTLIAHGRKSVREFMEKRNHK